MYSINQVGICVDNANGNQYTGIGCQFGQVGNSGRGTIIAYDNMAYSNMAYSNMPYDNMAYDNMAYDNIMAYGNVAYNMAYDQARSQLGLLGGARKI